MFMATTNAFIRWIKLASGEKGELDKSRFLIA